MLAVQLGPQFKSEAEMEIERTPSEALLTPIEVSKILRIPRSTLAAWRSTKRVSLPFVKVGHAVRYVRADIDRMIQGRHHEAG